MEYTLVSRGAPCAREGPRPRGGQEKGGKPLGITAIDEFGFGSSKPVLSSQPAKRPTSITRGMAGRREEVKGRTGYGVGSRE